MTAVMSKPPKEVWQDEFKGWLEQPMVKMVLRGLVPEGRNDDLMAVLEAAFEHGFTHGVTGTLGGLVAEMKSRAEKRNGGIEVPGIPQPDHGHA